ncbi:MAG TPA: heavy metal translocating P-type ATPase [Acidobacteriaceae bacterium]|nr:heavy metal translocating P-type ATPase [Acidobacteriaceae bacterium]
MKPLTGKYSIAGPFSHWFVAVVILCGMAGALASRYVLERQPASQVVLLIAIAVAAVPLIVEMAREILKGNFSVDLLAVLSIGTAVVLREYWVAAIVILMLSGGKALEEYATRRASSVLGALAQRMPQTAHRVTEDGSVIDVPAASVSPGDQLVLYPHELCPVDGKVTGGSGAMDESYLTGEPFLIEKAPGVAVLSGAINGEKMLTIEATKVASDSRYAKIVEVLHASEQDRPRIRRMADRLGRWYTPLAVGLAILSWAVSHQPERFLAVLVIATPCPLLLAIPVAVIGAISVSARKGIVIKDPSILEKVDRCETLIVDKTGTLTYGRPWLTEVIRMGAWTSRSLLQFAGTLERYSKHPLASAILRAASSEGIELLHAENVSESPGQGLAGVLDGHRVLLTGRGKLPPRVTGRLAELAPGLECVIVIDGEVAGVLRFHDEPRHESKPLLSHLQARHGIQRVVLLSGDRPTEVAAFGERMGITQVHGGKSPEEKLAIVRDLTKQAPTLYLGDGINDAPAMMHSTAGVALGVSSEITSEAAGAVILQSSLSSVDDLIHIGRRMRRIALTSAVGGMALSAIGMGAAAVGFLAPIEGAILQELIDLASILNSLRMILPVGQIGDFRMAPEASAHTAIRADGAEVSHPGVAVPAARH